MRPAPEQETEEEAAQRQAEHEQHMQEYQPDLLAKAEAVFALPKPQVGRPKDRAKALSKAKPTAVKAASKKSATQKKAA